MVNLQSVSPQSEAREAWLDAFCNGLRPQKYRRVSEWADEFRMIPRVGSAEPGRWRTARTPYLREPMDCLSEDSDTRKVVLLFSAQTGKSEVCINWAGYIIHHAPASAMMVQPTVEMAKGFSKERLNPSILETPVLAELVGDSRERDSGSIMLHKPFPGGAITLTGANSPVGLASRPIKNILGDEIDRWPGSVGDEGDPLKLIEARQVTFPDAKTLLASTPTIKELSRIWTEWLKSDQRQFHLPCPFCNGYQFLKMRNLKGERDENKLVVPESVHYECELCGAAIQERWKPQMLAAGQWRKHNPAVKDIAGFHVWGAYRPLGWKGWAAILTDFFESKQDKSKLQPFVNLELGEPWEEEGERVEPSGLLARRELYAAEVPLAVGVLTCAVDTQDDRLEYKIKGWGLGKESWLIEWGQIFGDPAKLDLWEQLDVLRAREFEHESGQKIKIAAMGIDTGGHYTVQAYDYCKVDWRRRQRVFALKGSNVPTSPLVSRPTRTNIRKVPLFLVGVTTAKNAIVARMQIMDEGPGCMHYPLKETVNEEYFKQLTSEKGVTRWTKGVPSRLFVKIYQRNEAFDLEVYNLATVEILNPNLPKLCEMMSKGTRAVPRETETAAREHVDPPPPDPRKRIGSVRPRRPGGWVNGWKR